MNKKELLDYLVSIGLGTKVVSSVRTNQPDFPNQDSIYYNKGTNFRTQQIKYTIEIPVMETDNTRVDVQVAYPGKTTPAPTMKDKIFAFLVMLFGDPYTQNYGVTFYSPNFGNKHYEGSPYRAKHWGGYVNIDSLLPLMSAFGGIGEGLDMAWFLNYLKDILAAWGIGEKKKIGNLDLLHLVKAGGVQSMLDKQKQKQEAYKEEIMERARKGENIAVKKEDFKEIKPIFEEATKKHIGTYRIAVSFLIKGEYRREKRYTTNYMNSAVAIEGGDYNPGDTISIEYLYLTKNGGFGAPYKYLEVVNKGRYKKYGDK